VSNAQWRRDVPSLLVSGAVSVGASVVDFAQTEPKIIRRWHSQGNPRELYCTALFTNTPFPHSAQMKASMDENPGKTYGASQ
jgi:hypothetical protein